MLFVCRQEEHLACTDHPLVTERFGLENPVWNNDSNEGRVDKGTESSGRCTDGRRWFVVVDWWSDELWCHGQQSKVYNQLASSFPQLQFKGNCTPHNNAVLLFWSFDCDEYILFCWSLQETEQSVRQWTLSRTTVCMVTRACRILHQSVEWWKILQITELCSATELVTCHRMYLLHIAFNALTLLVWHQEEHPTCKKIEWWGAGVVICLGKVQMICIWSSWCYYHPIISCFIKIQIGLTFLLPAYQGCPGKETIKWVFASYFRCKK